MPTRRQSELRASVKLPFGVGADGQPVSIFDARNGLDCNCTCPGCGSLLVAKQKVKEWHFAHHNSAACAAGYESALHLAIKRIIENEKQILLPACSVFRYQDDPTDNSPDHSSLLVGSYEYITEADYRERMADAVFLEYSRGETGYAQRLGGLVELDEVISEKNDGDIRPDLIAMKNGRRIFVEVAVTHFVDKVKLQKIRDLQTAAIEMIFLPSKDPLNWESLRRRVLEDSTGTRWLHNPKVESLADKNFLGRLKEFEKEERILAAKKKVYETAYKPTKDFVFTKGNSTQKIVVRLCPQFISLSAKSMYTATDPELKKIVEAIGFRFHAVFNGKQNQYEVHRDDVVFYAIAKSVLAEGLRLTSFHAPDPQESLNRLNASALTATGAIPPPTSWAVTLFDASAEPTGWPDYLHIEASKLGRTVAISISGSYRTDFHETVQAIALRQAVLPGQLRYTPSTPLVIDAQPDETVGECLLGFLDELLSADGMAVKRVVTDDDAFKASVRVLTKAHKTSI